MLTHTVSKCGVGMPQSHQEGQGLKSRPWAPPLKVPRPPLHSPNKHHHVGHPRVTPRYIIKPDNRDHSLGTSIMDPGLCISSLHIPPCMSRWTSSSQGMYNVGQLQEDESLFEKGTGRVPCCPPSSPSSLHLGVRVRGSARGRLPLCLLTVTGIATFQRW